MAGLQTQQFVGVALIVVAILLILIVLLETPNLETIEECEARIPTLEHAEWCQEDAGSYRKTQGIVVVVSLWMIVGGYLVFNHSTDSKD